MTILLEMIKTKSATVRILHWIIFFSTVDLVITGLYIGDPVLMAGVGEPYQTFVMAKTRLLHFTGAVCLDVAFLIRLYLAFFSTFHRDWKEVIPTPDNVRGAWDTMKYYWTFKGQLKEHRWVDPLDGLTFLALHFILAMQLFTGFALYVSGIELASGMIGLWAATLHAFTDWTGWLFGGLPGVRVVHHLTMWIVVSGAFLHIYMQVWKTIKLKRADISAIISGYKLMAVKKGE
ncbi:MAG: Ni/Fe-hydrogenase, b-type cytochrome subunit [Nitrospinae bacterium]|nr:Ni/Fe-hydrogenase, b-type cytochrome subunit [Nitrospinota bacterium]